jgi:hypothetical protein
MGVDCAFAPECVALPFRWLTTFFFFPENHRKVCGRAPFFWSNPEQLLLPGLWNERWRLGT